MAWTVRYVRGDAAGGGDGTTDTNSGANGAWTSAEGQSNEAAGMQINVRGDAGTYALATTTRLLSAAGTTTQPIWWRGYRTTPGDLDTDSASPLTHPLFTFTTGHFAISGAFHIFTGIDASLSNAAAATMILSGASCIIQRCRFTNTTANAASSVLSMGAANSPTIVKCYFNATATATNVVASSNATGTVTMVGNVFTGGGVGYAHSGGSLLFAENTLNQVGSHGLNVSVASTAINVLRNTFAGCGGDGFRTSTAPTTGLVRGNIFAQNGGWGINNTSGTNIGSLHFDSNDIGTSAAVNTSGKMTGFGDVPSLNEVNDTASPWTNMAGNDLSLAAAALARAGGGIVPVENQSYTSYRDCGAVQHQDSGGGLLYLPGMMGGMPG